MTRTYRTPWWTWVFVIAFGAVWIGFTIFMSLQEPPDSLGALVFAFAPLVCLFVYTQVTLADDGNCEFRSAVLRSRRIRAQRITKISADEGVIYVHHDRGTIQMWETHDFDDLLSRLLQLNSAIELDLDRPRPDATAVP